MGTPRSFRSRCCAAHLERPSPGEGAAPRLDQATLAGGRSLPG